MTKGCADPSYSPVVSRRAAVLAVAIGALVAVVPRCRAEERFKPEEAASLTQREAKECLKQNGILSLDRLRELTADVAAILARHKYGLELNAIQEVDTPTALALSNSEGPISLNGLRRLDEATALALANTRGSLTLEGLHDLVSVPLAHKLSKGGFLRLPRVAKFEKPVADAIAASGCKLEAESLVTLDHGGVTRAIVRNVSADVKLPLLSAFTGEAASALCTVPCHVYCPAVVAIGAAEVAPLTRHQGVLDFDGLRECPPEALQAILANNGPLGLGSIQSLGDPAPEGVLKALANHRWPLCLSGLKTLTVAEAKAIRARKAQIDLAGINKLTIVMAQNLINCDCVVWFMGVEELETGVVETLLRHKPRPETGFVFPVSLRSRIAEADALAFEQHEAIHFGGAYNP